MLRRRSSRADPGAVRAGAVRGLDLATVIALTAATVYLGLNAGGYFAGDTGWVCALLVVLLAARIAFSGLFALLPNRLTAIALAALAAFSLWTLASAAWSGDWGTSIIEFDRSLLFLVTLALFASMDRPELALRVTPHAIAVAFVFICAVGLATRVAPGLWPVEPPADEGKLGYPLTYSNALGAMAALGVIVCAHLASWSREPALVRAASAGALPILAATLALTFSDGALMAGALGLVLYLVLGFQIGTITAAIAAIPFAAIAAHAAAGATLLGPGPPGAGAALEEGHDVAVTVGLCCVGTVLVALLLVAAERRLSSFSRPRPPRPVVVGLVAAGLAVAGVAAVVVGPVAANAVTDELEGAQDRPGADSSPVVFAGQRRADYWRVAIDDFELEPLAGQGAGGFAETWSHKRPFFQGVEEGHSIVFETLGELGVVGMSLLVVLFGSILLGFARVLKRVSRPLGALGLATGLTWIVHATIDWDWELPALTLALFALGGTALSSVPADSTRGLFGGRATGSVGRAIAGVACLLIAVTPVSVAVSQSRLDGAVAALHADDCQRADQLARDSIDALPVRAEPYEVIAFCASRVGDHEVALQAMADANDRDPRSWEVAYGLALVRGAAGIDPRSAALRAFRLNPMEPLTRQAVRGFTGAELVREARLGPATADPQRWRETAAASPLPFPFAER